MPRPQSSRASAFRAAGPLLAALVLALASCKSLASKAWNLGQLHDDGRRHRYHGALESDIEYIVRHDVTRLLGTRTARIAEKEASAIANPSQRCLENLVDLQRIAPKDLRGEALQTYWFALLATKDPSRLSRERAALALGPLGRRVEAGVPVPLPSGQAPAKPEEVAGAAAALVRAVRHALDPRAIGPETPGASSTPPQSVDDACTALEALVLDVEGGARALDAAAQLWTVNGLRPEPRQRLRRTVRDVEGRLVRQALAAALLDKDPLVRAAAVEGAVACAGRDVLDNMLARLDREPAPEVIVRVLALVRREGLPDPPADLEPARRTRWREQQLEAIYGVLVSRAEAELHVGAMLALSEVSGAGFASLREEDWQAWIRARRASPPAGSGNSGSARAGAPAP